MTERHEFGEPVPAEGAAPERRADGRNPDEYVGGEFVGDRQRTHTIRGQDDAVEYRVGLDGRDRIVVDRRSLDRFVQSPESTRIKLAETPEPVREEADELRAEYASKTPAKPKPRPKPKSKKRQPQKR